MGEQPDSFEHEEGCIVTDEMLVQAGIVKPVALRKKANARAERIRLEALQSARRRFLSNASQNRSVLLQAQRSAEYSEWFEVFNGSRALADEVAFMGTDPAGLTEVLGLSRHVWLEEIKARARRAACKKGILLESLACCSCPRARRIIRIRLATPEWVDYDKIMAIYRQCKRTTMETGVEHHVDHIVPLAGRNAQGLHVHDNMQILTATQNLMKLNKFNDWA